MASPTIGAHARFRSRTRCRDRRHLWAPWAAILGGFLGTHTALGREANEIKVRTEIAPGPYLVGQAIDLGVGVVAAGPEPRIDPPRIAGGDAWSIGTESRPISASGIGEMVSVERLYLARFRIVARRPGPLDIPSISVHIQNRSGRSQPRRIEVQPVPPYGRPKTFLGGVGRFTLQADARPTLVRVGQEITFRVTVTGPAASGMNDPPDLDRYERMGVFSRIGRGPVEIVDEPPSRSFTYMLRPTTAGEFTLPPVVIASYDPSTARYFTQATAGVPIHVVAVRSFDAESLGRPESIAVAGRSTSAWWAIGAGLSAALIGITVAAALRRRYFRQKGGHGPLAAQRFAARLADSLEPRQGPSRVAATDEPYDEVARRLNDHLIRYLELGTGRPSGALTPEEARAGVGSLTQSAELGERAGRLTARCDLVQFGGHHAARPPANELIDDARGLFRALGRARITLATEPWPRP